MLRLFGVHIVMMSFEKAVRDGFLLNSVAWTWDGRVVVADTQDQSMGIVTRESI